MPAAAPQHVLISSIKDEGPYLLEWVAHHRAVGFDLICIASNDCRDGSEALLAALDRAGHIRHVPNVLAPGEIPQHAGYQRIRAACPVDAADWLMALDADEFLNVHVGRHRVSDLTATAPAEADIVALNGVTFGAAPQTRFAPGRVCLQFPFALPRRHRANRPVKSLTRGPARFRGIHNHHMVGWRGPRPPVVMRGDGSLFALPPGEPLWNHLREFPVEEIRHDLAQYNHYAIKSWDAFMVRRQRGRGAVAADGPELRRHTKHYFLTRCQVEAPEPSILRYGTQVAALLDEMLADPAIRAAHLAATARFAALAAAHAEAIPAEVAALPARPAPPLPDGAGADPLAGLAGAE